MSQALALPGTIVNVQPPVNNVDKLDPRFLAMLQQFKIPTDKITLLADADCDCAPLFGSLARDDKDFWKFCLDVLLVDPVTRPAETILRGRLTMLWEACKIRAEVEAKASAERAVARLPPQICMGDLETAKTAFEQLTGQELPKYLTPSESYFERKCGHCESYFKAEPLTEITNFNQQDSNAMPGLDFDSPTGTFKQKKKDFAVPFPSDAEELSNRFKVLAAATMFCKMRYASNPKLTSASMELFQRYFDYLKGPRVWGYITKDRMGQPLASPHIGHIISYDLAIREQVAQAMNQGADIKSAFEAALGNSDLRETTFAGAYRNDTGTEECRALTAPGLAEQYPSMRGKKRALPLALENGAKNATALQATRDRNKAKKERQKAAKAAAAAQRQGSQNQHQQQQTKGGGKATGKGGKQTKGTPTRGQGDGMPQGAKSMTPDNRSLCFNFNKDTCTRGANCRFAHVCWFCFGNHSGSSGSCPTRAGGPPGAVGAA